jgi:cell division protein FtsA
MCGIRLEAKFHIITGQLTASRNILRCLEKVGLKVAGMTLEPIASANAVLTSEEKEAGVAMVDIGGGTTDITIYKDGIIRHTAVVPFGGNVITNDIKEACSVMQDQAEKLKVKFGSALHSELSANRVISVPGLKGRDPKEISEKNLAKIIECRVEEIFDYVMWEIKRSGYSEKLIAGLVLTGGGSLLKNIETLADYCTGLPSRLGEPVEYLSENLSHDLSSPIYSTSIGLLLTALDDVEYIEEEDATIFDLEDDQEGDEESKEDVTVPDNDKTWYKKIFTYTKEYFETTPDTEF